MLGKLARYLRMAGFDTLYIGREGDPVEEARKSGRVLVTRNRLAAARCAVLGIECIEVRDNYPHNQTREVMRRMKRGARPSPYTRCVFCNTRLEEVGDKAAVEGWVPPFVYKSQDRFKKCPGCGRIFWNATHKKSMDRFMKSIFGA